MKLDIIGIDPGTKESAVVHATFGFGLLRISGFKEKNENVASYLTDVIADEVMAIEKIVANGQRVNYETMDTALWAGYFGGIFHATHPDRPVFFIPRPKIRWHIGRTKKVTDSTIRKTLTARFGKMDLVGDQMAAFAVAVTCFDLFNDSEFRGKYEHERTNYIPQG